MRWSKMEKLRGKYSWIGVDPRNEVQVLQIAEFRAGQWVPDRRNEMQKWRPAMEIVTFFLTVPGFSPID